MASVPPPLSPSSTARRSHRNAPKNNKGGPKPHGCRGSRREFQSERVARRRIHGGFHSVAGPGGTITVDEHPQGVVTGRFAREPHMPIRRAEQAITVEVRSACKALGMRDRVRAGAQHPEQQQQRRTSTAGWTIKSWHEQAWCDAP